MYFQLVRIEQQKLTHRHIFWLALGLMIFAIMLTFGGIFFFKTQFEAGNANNEGGGLVIQADSAQEIEAQLLWPSGIRNSFAVASVLGTYLIIVLVGAITAQEYTWRTVTLWLSRGVPRPLFLLAKFTAVLITSLIFMSTAVLLGSLISGGFSLVILGNLPFDSLNWGLVGLNIVTMTLSLLPYAALTFLLAVLSRSTIVAIGGGLAYVALIEPLMLQLLPLFGEGWQTFSHFWPGSLARTVGLYLSQIEATAPALTLPDGAMMPQTAVISLILTTIILISIALFSFQKQDLGG